MLKKLITLLALISMVGYSFACTAVDITAKDGSVIAARDLYWGYNMDWQLMSIPKGSDLILTAPPNTGLKPIRTKTKYSLVGMGVGPKVIADMPIIEGQNSAGLGISANFLAIYTQYQDISKTDQNYMSITQFGTWLLGNFSSVAEVEKELPKYKVWGNNKVNLGPAPPTVHYIITDKSGANIVVEFVKGQLHIYTSTSNTLSNEPTYDWHLANLGNYIALSSKKIISTVTSPAGDLSQLNQGVSVYGIPGDYSSPARFIRATFLRYYSDQPKNDAEAIELTVHILNNVDVPYGVIKKKNEVVYTQWLSVKDLTHNKWYFADYKHRGNMLTIDVEKLFAESKEIIVPIDQFQYPTNDITNSLIK